MIEIEPGEICIIPRGVIFSVELSNGPARAYVCENYGGAFTLPDRGPIGANCLANRPRFSHPGRRLRGQGGALVALRQMGRRALQNRDRPIAARRRRVARKLRALQIRPASLLAGRRDPVRSSRSVDLHGDDRAVGDARYRQRRLRDLSGALVGGGEYVPAALVSPQPDVGIHGPGLRRLRRQAGRFRARRHFTAQPHAAARPRCRRPSTTQATSSSSR